MLIGGRPTNPGELRTAVTFYERAITTGTGGFQAGGKGDKIADARVRWKNVHGQEVWDAAAVNAVNAATVLARYHASIDESCLVEKDSKLYEIVSMDDIEERHEYLELKVQRMKAG